MRGRWDAVDEIVSSISPDDRFEPESAARNGISGSVDDGDLTWLLSLPDSLLR